MIALPALQSSSVAEIADFAEVECLRRRGRSASVTHVSRVLGRETSSDDDDIHPVICDAFGDLASRVHECGPIGRYPYDLSENQNVIRLSRPSSRYSYLYQYLLLSTRLNMNTQKVQAGEDSTELFELLCAEVAKNFFSTDLVPASSLVFGTGRYAKDRTDAQPIPKKGFARAIDELCRELGEGGGFQNHAGNERITAKDGRLDVVVWRGFRDGRVSRLIAMGQCKTGRNWKNAVDSLQPDNFLAKWVKTRPANVPLRMFFVTERVGTNWHNLAVDAGLLFDRCRIMEYADHTSDDLHARIRAWVEGAHANLKVANS